MLNRVLKEMEESVILMNCDFHPHAFIDLKLNQAFSPYSGLCFDAQSSDREFDDGTVPHSTVVYGISYENLCTSVETAWSITEVATKRGGIYHPYLAQLRAALVDRELFVPSRHTFPFSAYYVETQSFDPGKAISLIARRSARFKAISLAMVYAVRSLYVPYKGRKGWRVLSRNIDRCQVSFYPKGKGTNGSAAWCSVVMSCSDPKKTV